MSRWPTEPLVLALSPSPPPPPPPASSGRGAAGRVDAALAAWRAALDAAAPPPRRQVQCLLRDDLVRFRVVPWNDLLHSPAARHALARQSFIDAFGETARTWDVQIDAPHYGCASLACAIDARLLAGLVAELATRGLRSAGVQPAFVQAVNEERRRLPPQGAWLVLGHAAGHTLLLVQGSQPRHVKQVAGTAQGLDAVVLDTVALDALVQRESFALGLDTADAALLPVLHLAQRQVNGPVHGPVREPMHEPLREPVHVSVHDSVHESVHQPVHQPAREPTRKQAHAA